jgi:hypothetical protein
MGVKQSAKGQREILTFDRSNLVLVEGGDDAAFVVKQIELCGVPDDWHVHDMHGKDTDWVEFVGLAVEDSDWFRAKGHSLALVRDGDDEPAGAYRSLQHVLNVNGLPVPSKHGEVATGGKLNTGIWVMPDGSAHGALEELLVRSFPVDRISMAGKYIEDISAAFERPNSPMKNTVLAYFAGHLDHIKTIPSAMNKQAVIPRDHAAFEQFRVFLRDLAGASPSP